MPEHYEPTRREHLVMAAYGLGNAIAGACGKIHARRVVVGRVLAALACAFAGWHARGQLVSGAYTLGATRVQAASEPSGAAGALGEPFGAAEPLPTPTADPRLQPGYVDPSAQATAADEPLPAWLPPTVARWETLIRAGAEPYNVDPALVAIVMTIESAGNRKAGSKAGARSLMQVMPATARGIDRERGRPHDPAMIEDPAANIDYGVYNLAWCMRTYGLANDPDWRQTIGRACRCYNGGPSAVDSPLPESRDHDRWVTGMWAERHDASSPTFDEWRAAGGQVALDIAATVDGPPMYVQPVAPGGPDHLEVLR